MMLIDYIQRSQKRITEAVSSFYTPTGIHVYFKEPLTNDDIDIEAVIRRVEESIPSHL